MTFRSYGATCLGVALLLAPASPLRAQQHQLSVRNDTGHVATCGVRRAGSSAIDSFTVRTGEIWAMGYAGSKARMILCEGAASHWQQLDSDRRYRLVKAGDQRIVAQPVS
ncbi:MAG: hypothetical protein JWO81_2394 [Alphaproteobacteria bacterium]|nr:hypothetical protein [Alphaproteobacteria bacterium]